MTRHDKIRYEEASLHVIMAGTGDPYAALNSSRLRLLYALHDGLALDDIEHLFELSPNELRAELAPLILASLVSVHDDVHQPAFFIADADETHRVATHADRIGTYFAHYLMQEWSQLERTFEQLSISNTQTFYDHSFFLVGNKLLDTTLLDALAKDAHFMPPAPARPSPKNKHARYYFWMIDGTHDHLGKYGQRPTKLPWKNWLLLTFGNYEVNGEPNIARNELEQMSKKVAVESGTVTVQDLANHLRLPVFDCDDTYHWLTAMRPYANALVAIYYQHEHTIRSLYESLQASKNTIQNFGDFFCWYDHLVYAHAIDQLVQAGLMQLPDHEFAAALWCENPEEQPFFRV